MNTLIEQEYKAPSHIAKSGFTLAAVSPADLIGTWNNVDHDTRDLVKVKITARGASIMVDAFGACSPTPCNWGTVTGIAYASTVNETPAVAFTAQYSFSFAHVILIGHLQGRKLHVESFTQFTDGSGRSNLYSTDSLTR